MDVDHDDRIWMIGWPLDSGACVQARESLHWRVPHPGRELAARAEQQHTHEQSARNQDLSRIPRKLPTQRKSVMNAASPLNSQLSRGTLRGVPYRPEPPG